MNWFADNKLFSGSLAAIVLAILALGFLAFSGSGQYTEAEAAYQAGMTKLTQLRSIAPYRDAGNLKKRQEQVATYRELTDGLHKDLIEKQGVIDPMEPSAFQTRLRELVSKTVEHATNRGVELPPKFYLGFETYESQLPRNDVTGLLNWQLTAVNSVITRLIDLKVAKINSVVRAPLPGEITAEEKAKEAPLLKKYPFFVSFTGYPGNLQATLNDLVSFPQFTIARAVRVENEQLKSPAQGGAVPGTEAVATEPATDRIVIGKEKITATIVIDLVHFTPKPDIKK